MANPFRDNEEWLEQMRKGFKSALCDNCGNPLMFSLYPSAEYWTGCNCNGHVPYCLGRHEDDE